MSKPRVIGLYSPAPQSGKTAVAEELQQHGYVCVSFAGPLKRMIGVFLNSAGYEHERIESLLYEQKENRIPEFGVTSRHLLQTIGTEWGRECISPDVWVKVWHHNVMKWLDGGLNVVVDDMRFPNEWEAVKALEGECWYITRPRTEKYETEHASEGALNNHGFDRRFTNDTSLNDLHIQVRKALEIEPALLGN